MKRFFGFLTSVAAIVATVSCNQEVVEPDGGNTVTYSISVPGVVTKAAGDNVSNVTELLYEVYRASEVDDLSKAPVYEGMERMSAGHADLTLNFVNDQDFVVLFWAQDPGGTMYSTDDLRNVTLVAGSSANTESSAAFCGLDTVSDCVSAKDGKVKMTRPVALINLATTPEGLILGTNATVTMNSSSMVVTGLSNSYNVATQEVGEVAQSGYAYASAAVPAGKLSTNGKDYTYAAFAYAGFAPLEGASVQVSYTIVTSEGEVSGTVDNVPVMPNYRTNIIGNLISSDENFDVDLDDEWSGTYTGPEFGVTSEDDINEALKDITANLDTEETTVITLADGVYDQDIDLTVANLGTPSAGKGLVFKAAPGAAPVIAGTVTLGYRNQGVGATMYNVDITFDGIKFDHAAAAAHSISVEDVKSLTLRNCTVIGDGEYGISSERGNGTGASKIENCTFVNAGMQILGNFGTGLVIDNCTFNESRINVQAGDGVTVQNCVFTNTMIQSCIGDSFYLVRSNSTPITVKNCTLNIGSDLPAVAADQAKWGIFTNRGTTDWTVEDVTVKMTGAAAMQTSLEVTKCTSTGVINTTNLVVNCYASSTADLAGALEAGVSEVYVEGEFKMPSYGGNASVIINGLNGAVIDNTLGSYCDNATLTFNNVNFKTSTGMANGDGSDYAALYSKNVTYNKCNFSGPMRLGRDGAKFVGCTFNDLGNDYVWTYGNAASFEGCTFNSAGKALLIYSDGGNGAPAVSVTNCIFNATQGAKASAIANQDCAAIEIHNYGYGVTLTTSGNTIDSDFSGEWRIKAYEIRNADNRIFVNGTEYTTIALDGKTMTIDANKNVTINE